MGQDWPKSAKPRDKPFIKLTLLEEQTWKAMPFALQIEQ
jgi:hypothetical protein